MSGYVLNCLCSDAVCTAARMNVRSSKPIENILWQTPPKGVRTHPVTRAAAVHSFAFQLTAYTLCIATHLLRAYCNTIMITRLHCVHRTTASGSKLLTWTGAKGKPLLPFASRRMVNRRINNSRIFKKMMKCRSSNSHSKRPTCEWLQPFCVPSMACLCTSVW